MRDLDQKMTELVDAYRPGPSPAFSVLQRRSRRRHRSRQVVAAVGVIVAVAAAGILPSTLIGRHASEQAAPGDVIPYTTPAPKATDAPPPDAIANPHNGPGFRVCVPSELALTITWRRRGADLKGDATVAFRPYVAPGTKAACGLTPDEPSLVLLGPGDGRPLVADKAQHWGLGQRSTIRIDRGPLLARVR